MVRQLLWLMARWWWQVRSLWQVQWLAIYSATGKNVSSIIMSIYSWWSTFWIGDIILWNIIFCIPYSLALIPQGIEGFLNKKNSSMSSSSAVATGLPIQAEAIPVQRASTPDSRNTQVLAARRLSTLHVSSDIFPLAKCINVWIIRNGSLVFVQAGILVAPGIYLSRRHLRETWLLIALPWIDLW